MPTPALLTPDQTTLALQALPPAGPAAWRLEEGQLALDLRLPSFAAAMGFMTAVAVQAERMDHHPEWRNVYDRVWVRLSTHSAGGLTALDFELARHISRTAGALLAA